MATLTLKGKSDADFTSISQAMEYGRQIEQDKDVLEAEIRSLQKQLEDLPLWETIANAVSAYRVFPRIAIILFGVMTYDIVQAALHSTDTGYQDTGLAATIALAFSASLSAYMGTGKGRQVR